MLYKRGSIDMENRYQRLQPFLFLLASSTTTIFWCVEHFYWNCSCGYIRWQSVIIIYATGFELAHIKEKKHTKKFSSTRIKDHVHITYQKRNLRKNVLPFLHEMILPSKNINEDLFFMLWTISCNFQLHQDQNMQLII